MSAVELEDVKATMKSLVVSSPTTMDVRALARDYREMTGGYIPYSKYGYRELVPFLKEICADCFVYSGHPANPIVTPIINERTRHINNLVSKQRISSGAKHKMKRTSIFENQIKPKPDTKSRSAAEANVVPSLHAAMKPSVQAHGISFAGAPVAKQDSSRYFEKKTYPRHNINHNPDRPQHRGGTLSSIERTLIPGLCENGDSNMRSPINKGIFKSVENKLSPSSSRVEKQYEKPTKSSPQIVATERNKMEVKENKTQRAVTKYPEMTAENNLCSEPTLNQYRETYDQIDSASNQNQTTDHQKLQTNSLKCSPIKDSSKKSRVQCGYNAFYLNSIKSKLEEMLDAYPEGVWMEELAELFRDMFGCELEYKRLGHGSLVSLCRDMADTVCVESVGRPEELLVVAAREREPTARRLPPPPRPRPAALKALYPDTDEQSGDSEDALGGMPYDEGIFPEDCMDRLESIPRLPLSKLQQGQLMEVIISEVLDPSHFWFQLRSDEHDLALSKLMDEMTEYYKLGEGRGRVMEFGAVQVGQYCATNFSIDGWHRSVIVQLIGTDSVKVRHVDYGSVTTVSRKELRYLCKRWAALPAQALRGCLAELRPAGGASCWMHSAAERLLKLVSFRPLVAEIHSLDTQAEVVRMYLADTNSEVDVYINQKLVEENCASFVDFDTEILGDFLLPTFEDVENGSALNFADKCEMLRAGIYPEGAEQEHPFTLPVVVRPPNSIGRATAVPQHASPTAAGAASSSWLNSLESLAQSTDTLITNRIPQFVYEDDFHTPSSSGHTPSADSVMETFSITSSQLNGEYEPWCEYEQSCLESTETSEAADNGDLSCATRQLQNLQIGPPSNAQHLDSVSHANFMYSQEQNYNPQPLQSSSPSQIFTQPSPHLNRVSQAKFMFSQEQNYNPQPLQSLSPSQIFTQPSPHLNRVSQANFMYAQGQNYNPQPLQSSSPSEIFTQPSPHLNRGSQANFMYPQEQNYNPQRLQSPSPSQIFMQSSPHLNNVSHANLMSLQEQNYNPQGTPKIYPNVDLQFPQHSITMQPSRNSYDSYPMQPGQSNAGSFMPPAQPAQYRSTSYITPSQYQNTVHAQSMHSPTAQHNMSSNLQPAQNSHADSVWNLPLGTESLSHLNNLQTVLPGIGEQFQEMRMNIPSAPPHIARGNPPGLGNIPSISNIFK